MFWKKLGGVVFSLGILSIESAEIDVAIIGAGVTGTYVGWKLTSTEQPKNVHIFEATGRVGGRLYTVFFPDMENLPVELGGMRFRDTHQRVNKLATDLGLTVTPFISGDTNNFCYLRGVHLRRNELTDPAKLPYKLAKNEEGKTSWEIIANTIPILCPNFNNLTQEEWLAKRATLTYQGVPLKDLSWLNFLTSQLSPEAFQLAVDVGDVSLVYDSSALSHLNFLKEPPAKKLLKIVEGYQALPIKLADSFKEKGGSLHLNHQLIQIQRLSAQDVKSGYELIFQNDKGEKFKYTAAKVILTISPTALLELLPKTPLVENEALKSNLRGVSPNVLTKLFFAYDKAWWKPLGLSQGNSLTSTPLRSCYYFGSEEDFAKNRSENKNSLLLASYQGGYVPFWRALNDSPPFFNVNSENIDQDLIPGENLVKQAEHQLKLLHGLTDIPKPFFGVFQDWGKAPYYAAFYIWNVGIDPQQVDKDVRKPQAEDEIFIFTSDFCESQGWVESALVNSDRLLSEHFEIKK